jgi:hypothetical protein
MRRPELAIARKRNRARVAAKRGPGVQRSRARMAAPSAAARERMRCGFGALRIGAFLGRLRLHLETDRFLAAHRDDAVWEEGCVEAVYALANLVAGMREAVLDSALPSQRNLEWRAWGESLAANAAERLGEAAAREVAVTRAPGAHGGHQQQAPAAAQIRGAR